MKRSIQKWQDSDPDYMVKKLSRLGLLSALRDAKADILELHAEVEQGRDMMVDHGILIGTLASRLCVDMEPHQTFEERLLEAVREKV